MKHVVIKPRTGWSALNLREIVEFRDLLVVLFTRDIKLRYKQTALGIAWVVLQPLLTAVLFTVLFGKIAKFPSQGHPYLIFAVAGMLPWFLFSQAITRGGNSLTNNSTVISKVYFPRMMLPITVCMAVLVDFAVCLATLVFLMAWYQIALTWNIVFFPVFLFAVFALSLGCTLLVSAVNVFYRDTVPVVQFLVQLMMYASPVAYALDVIPAKWQALYAVNPMVGIIEAFRWCFLGCDIFPWGPFGWSFCFTVFIFVASIFVFRRVERYFADVI